MKKLLLILCLTIFPISDISAQLVKEQETAKVDETALISPDTRVNYTKLRDALKAKNWRKANDLTQRLILLATGQDDQGWLNAEKTAQLSCWDLKTIDNLWRKYSDNHFGFSVQLPIFIETGNKPGKLNNQEAYEIFGEKMGWRKDGDWIIFKGNLNYSLNSPVGHLPEPRDEYEIGGGRLEYTTIAKRMVDCKIVDISKMPNQNLPKN